MNISGMLYILLISVLTLAIRLITLDLMLCASCGDAPNAGSLADVLPQPIRARKRSSLRIAMAFTRRMETVRWMISGLRLYIGDILRRGMTYRR